MWRFPYVMFWVLKWQWSLEALFYLHYSGPLSNLTDLLQAQTSRLAMTCSLPFCLTEWRRLKLSSSGNCKVSPLSQPIMTRSTAIARPLMYFGACPLLYLAKLLRVYCIATGSNPLPKIVYEYIILHLIFPCFPLRWHLACVSLPHFPPTIKNSLRLFLHCDTDFWFLLLPIGKGAEEWIC